MPGFTREKFAANNESRTFENQGPIYQKTFHSTFPKICRRGLFLIKTCSLPLRRIFGTREKKTSFVN